MGAHRVCQLPCMPATVYASHRARRHFPCAPGVPAKPLGPALQGVKHLPHCPGRILTLRSSPPQDRAEEKAPAPHPPRSYSHRTAESWTCPGPPPGCRGSFTSLPKLGESPCPDSCFLSTQRGITCFPMPLTSSSDNLCLWGKRTWNT